MGQWQEWIGRSHVQSEQLTPALVRRHRATLDLSPDDPAPLAGIHWCLNLPEAASAELGEDGHPRRAGTIAAVAAPAAGKRAGPWRCARSGGTVCRLA